MTGVCVRPDSEQDRERPGQGKAKERKRKEVWGSPEKAARGQ